MTVTITHRSDFRSYAHMLVYAGPSSYLQPMFIGYSHAATVEPFGIAHTIIDNVH